MKKRRPSRRELFGSSRQRKRFPILCASWHMQWRMQLTKKCGYCAVTFLTTISGKLLTMRPPGLLILARGRTGIPKWVAIPHRRDPYDGSEISWDRIDWILCNLMEIPIQCGNPALKRSAATQG